MSKLEDLQPNASVRGILPDALVTVVSVQWFGSEALELTYKDPGGQAGQRAALPARRAALRGRRAGPALELRRRRRTLPPRLRGASHPPRAPLRSGARRPHLARRAAAAPDHGRLRGDAAAPAAALPARRRSRRRQDDHGRAADQGADRPRRPAALPRSSARAASPSSGRTSSTAASTCPSRSSPTTSSKPRAPATGSSRTTSSSPASTSSPATRTCRQKLAGARLPLGPRRLRRGAQDVGHRTSAARSSTPSATGSASSSRRSRATSC